MSEACTHDCSNCHADCSSRAPQHEPPHAKSHIKKVIGVVSGKGGVGKSMTSAMMAVSMRRKGYKVGVLDADITGPSIPKLFGVHGPAMGTEDGINPVESHTGIKIMSINLLLDHPEMSAMDCIRESKRIMSGNKGQLFVLDLSFIGWWILAGIPIVGLFVRVWVVPYTHMTYALYYTTLTGTNAPGAIPGDEPHEEHPWEN